jgi:hypothetical protein
MFMAAAAWQADARADSKLEASYAITFARIPVGDATLSADLKESGYTIAMTGRAGGVARMVVNGEASLSARGILKDGRPEPRSFTSRITSEGESQDATTAFEEGNVTEVAVTPPTDNRGLEVPEADRRGVLDPLSAMLVAVDAASGDLSQDACRRTLPIFDGRQRYDLKLAFKRMDKVSAEKGYAGPVVVCGLNYQPVAGHRASNPLFKYLSDGREMEVVLAPVAGARVLAPFGLSIGSTLASLVIWASRFEATAQPPAAPENADPKPR